MEVKIKQRKVDVLETSPIDSSAGRPTATSQKCPAPQRRGSEVEDPEAPSSDQVFDPIIAPTADPIPILEKQRKDIDRIMARVDNLQQYMISLNKIVKSHNLVENDDLLTHNIINDGSRLSELDSLKLEMKIMQQRIKRMEESRSKGRSSPTTNQQVISCKDAASGGLLLPASRTHMSAYFDNLFTPQATAIKRHDAVDGSDSLFQGLPLGSKAEALPPRKSFTPRPKTSVNGTASRGRHTPFNVPPPQVPRKRLEQKNIRGRSSDASIVADPRTASTSMAGTTKSSPRITSRKRDASICSQTSDQEDPEYDDELVHDVHPQSLTRSSTRKTWQPASKDTPSRQNQTSETAPQPPSKTQPRRSMPTLPPTPGPSTKTHPARGPTSHHDSKRRKTTAVGAATPTASIWAAGFQDSRSRSRRRDERGRLVRS